MPSIRISAPKGLDENEQTAYLSEKAKELFLLSFSESAADTVAVAIIKAKRSKTIGIFLMKSI